MTRQAVLQSKCTGGTTPHMPMAERLSSGTACGALLKRALPRFRLRFTPITLTFSIFPTHGYLTGEHPFCPTCDEERLTAKRAALLA